MRVVAPTFVAGFETDGVVRRAAPILRRHILGLSDVRAAEVIDRHGWTAEAVEAVPDLLSAVLAAFLGAEVVRVTRRPLTEPSPSA